MKIVEEATMRSKFSKWFIVYFLFLLLHPLSRADAQKVEVLIGREILNFTLPSTHDRLVNYVDDYYGKHYLVITFFPAAFTPI